MSDEERIITNTCELTIKVLAEIKEGDIPMGGRIILASVSNSQTTPPPVTNPGRWVAVGNAGVCVYTDDGVTWTRSQLPDTSVYYSVVYADGLFVACGPRGFIAAGDDGVNWRKIEISTFNGGRGVAYGDGRWVVLNGSMTVKFSTDGMSTWQQGQYFSPGVSIGTPRAIKYDRGYFYVLSQAGRGFRSPTGETGTWEELTLPGTGVWLSMAVAPNGRMFISGSGGSYAYSDNGLDWTPVDPGGSDAFYTIYGNDEFILGYPATKLYRSPEATEWTASTVTIGRAMNAFSYGGGKYVSAGDGGYAAYSNDGLSWVPTTTGQSNSLNSLAFKPNP